MIKTAETYHVPVLLKESVDGLNIQPGGIYVDVTFGGGGHSKEILSRLTEGAHLYSFDQDADAERNVVANENFTFVCSNFRFLKNWMRYYGVDGLDGLLADLGVSSHHFDDETRGFSFRFDSPLDLHVLSLSLAFILSQDQTLHSNKNFKNYLFRSVIISVESLLGLALAVCFQTFQYL